MRSSITNFAEKDDETMYDAWERFKALTRECPHHGIDKGLLLHFFYRGLSKQSKACLDAGAGGPIMNKVPDEAFKVIEEVAKNYADWRVSDRKATKKGGRYDLDTIHMLNSKIDALASQLQKSSMAPSTSLPPPPQSICQTSISSQPSMPMQILFCDLCGSYDHTSSHCRALASSSSHSPHLDQVNAFSSFPNQNLDPFSNSYNPGWRQHPNFSWRGGQPHGQTQGQGQFGFSHGNYGQNQNQNQFQRPAGFNQVRTNPQFQSSPHAPPPQKSNLESLMETFVATQTKKNHDFEESIKQLQTHNKMIETQIAQLAIALKENNKTQLPSQSQEPREHVNAIMTRSGRVLSEVIRPEGKEKELSENLPQNDQSQEEEKQESSKEGEESSNKKPSEPTSISMELISKLPYPQRFARAKLDERFGKFLEMLKKIYVNIPFIDVIREMPNYAKFLKEILTNKRSVEVEGPVAMAEHCSAIIQKRMPPKLKDPGSFSIPCAIGNQTFDRALCDLGASVSVIPYSVCKKLGLGEPSPTKTTLQLADRSMKVPVGKLIDVPVKIGKFHIPEDFIVLDIEEDVNTPIILGRPFMASGRAMIDIEKGSLVFRVGDENVEFRLPQFTNDPRPIDGDASS